MRKLYRVNDVLDDFASDPASCTSEPRKPPLSTCWWGGSEVKAMTQHFARDTVTPPTTEDTAEVVVVKNFKTALILYAQGQISQP